MTEINISKVIADNGNAEGKLIITVNVDKVSDLENLFGPKIQILYRRNLRANL